MRLMCLSRPKKLVLALCERELRRELDVDHHADAAVQLKKGCRFFPGQYLPKDRHIFLSELRCGHVRIQPAANEAVRLLICLRSVLVGIFSDQRGSGVVDLCKICRMLIVRELMMTGKRPPPLWGRTNAGCGRH